MVPLMMFEIILNKEGNISTIIKGQYMETTYNFIKKLCKQEIIDSNQWSLIEQYKIFGLLCSHRCASLAYYSLIKSGSTNRLREEVRKYLECIYKTDVRINREIEIATEYLRTIMSNAGLNFAIVNEAGMRGIYPKGIRVNKYIELLVEPADVKRLLQVLKNSGYNKVGDDVGKIFLCKQVDWKDLDRIEIIVSSSVKNANNQELLHNMLNNSELFSKLNDLKAGYLDPTDYFIYMCLSMYIKARSYQAVQEGKDLRLSSFVDIYYYLMAYDKGDFIDKIKEKCEEYNVKDAVYYALWGANEIIGIEDKNIKKLMNSFEADNDLIVNRVYDLVSKKEYRYNDSFIERVFNEWHIRNLILMD